MTKLVTIDYEEYQDLQNAEVCYHQMKNALEDKVILDSDYYDEIKKIKNDLSFVLEQVLGAFEQTWCIDWNFTDIRERHKIPNNYEWRKKGNDN